MPLVYFGMGAAKFQPNPQDEDPQVKANKANRVGHSRSLKKTLLKVRADWEKELETRRDDDKSLMGNKIVLGLKMPSSLLDLTIIEKQFGLELVAEGVDGLLLASSEDLDFAKLEKVIDLFSRGETGGGNAASILEIYGPKDEPRLREILDESLFEKWPFVAGEDMTLDVLIEIPHNPGYLLRDGSRGPQGESPEEKIKRKVDWTKQSTTAAFEKWDEAKDNRIKLLTDFICRSGGKIVQQTEDPAEEEDGIVRFPDSISARISMSGLGFRDLILTIPWLIYLEIPAELQKIADESSDARDVSEGAQIIPPSDDAPAVCIIDSGIQEGHRLLRAAVLTEDSMCFIPGKDPNDTADDVQPSGHGTKVAGAVLYPELAPNVEVIEPIAWIQNARILNDWNSLSYGQNQLRNIQDIVKRYRYGARKTRLFVHSVAADEGCRRQKMTAWAALLDTHSHQDDVLFFQVTGNVSRNNTNVFRLGVKQHADAGRAYPDYLLEDSARLASPSQSLHAITVGSITQDFWEDGDARSVADGPQRPSGFSRSGLGLWGSVKPDLVEYGGDYQKTSAGDVKWCVATAPLLVQSTRYGSTAIGRDIGTSFAAPKVAHIAAVLQKMFPAASSQLYRALIINSTRWPRWAERLPEAERIKALRLIGYGIPDLARATENTSQRVTLITPEVQEIINGRAMIFYVPVPTELRDSSNPCSVRIDVTLSYTAEPRQTRATRYGYLETWLSWMSSNLDEPLDSFINRATKTGGTGNKYTTLPWMLRDRADQGGIEGASRQKGTAQKDWAFVKNVTLPEKLAIAVQAHKGWNREDHGGLAKFALVVSFEAIDSEIPVHSLVRSEIEAAVQQRVEV